MTDTPSTQHFQEKMQNLRRDYLNRLKKNLRDVRRLKELLLENMAPVKDLQELSRLTHNLNGSGATFGFPDISLKAGQLHLLLKDLVDGSPLSRLPGNARDAVIISLDDFYEASRQAINRHGVIDTAGWTTAPPVPLQTEKTVAIVSRKDNALCKKIRTLPGCRILHVSSLQTLASLDHVDLLIVSNDLVSADEAYLQELLDHHRPLPVQAPVLFALKHDDLDARFAAMRLGAQGYFDCDADSAPLVELITRATRRTALHELTGAVVSRDTMLNGFYEHALQQMGVKTRLLAPRDFARSVASTDFFMVDFETPWGKGTDFIAILQREKPAPVIFFLCTRDEYNSLDMVPGAITLLLKPFAPDYLVKIIGRTLSSQTAAG